MKGTEIGSEIPQGDRRSSRREQRESWSLGYKGEQGFEKGPLLWYEGSFPFRSHRSTCRLKRLLWKENSEKQKSWEAASIHKGKPRYWFSLCPQGELLRHNLETRGCSCEPGRDSSLHFYLNVPMSTSQDLQTNRSGVALFCSLGVGLPVVTLLCHLHLVILGPTRAKPHYFHPVPSYPLHCSWNILSHCLFG